MREDKDVGRRASEGAPSPREGTGDLISYLVVRFVLVLVAVMVVESLVVWIESFAMKRLLWSAVETSPDAAPQTTSSVIALLHEIVTLVAAMARADYLRVVGAARGSLAVVMLVAMIVLLVLPPLLGAVIYARAVARKVRSLQEARERELARIDQQRNQFMTDIAHDLRTPLMAISGMAQAVSDGVVHDEAMREEYLRSIRDKADKMSGLVSSVFDYTKLGSGTFQLDRETIDLPQLLLREAAVAYSDIEDASMSLSLHVPEDPCAVFADPVQLARVVANLLTNAVRHNAPGTEIALMLLRQAGVAYVVVADTGGPIEGDPDELFRPFSRGDKARRDTGGSGLGLSICKRIAELHGYELAIVQPYGRFGKAFVLLCSVEG